MRKTLNRERIEGRLYDFSNLAEKVTGEGSKNPGTPYIGGSIDIATDDECLNIVTIHFTYVTEKTSKGKPDSRYKALKNILDNGKSVLANGKDAATMLRVDTALALNDFYTSRNGEETLVSAKRNESGFITFVNTLGDKDSRSTFEFDMLINGTQYVEADEERHIAADYLIVKGAIFSFSGAILPVELVVKNPGGIKYFESLEASPKNLTFTKVWGKIQSQTIVDRREEESAFGEPAVKEYTRTIREWVIEGTSKPDMVYEIGDSENGITEDEIKKALADREVYLADIKKRSDEWKASQSKGDDLPFGDKTAKAPAAAGGFNF